MKYRINMTGWAGAPYERTGYGEPTWIDETFEDDVTVDATSTDDAIDKAVQIIKERWGYDYLEIGDVTIS